MTYLLKLTHDRGTAGKLLLYLKSGIQPNSTKTRCNKHAHLIQCQLKSKTPHASNKHSTPTLGFIAHHGVGKTQLLTQLLPLLCERGICTGVIKHSQQHFDADKPGTDSYALRKAGAQQMLVASKQRWVRMVEREFEHEPRIDAHLAHFEHESLDLILIEGFTGGTFPKIELHRPTLCKPLLFPNDKHIIAIASDSPLILPVNISLLNLNNPPAIVNYICQNTLNTGQVSAK